MKIAVCYSGQYRAFDGWQENHRDCLPEADYYYSTWKSEKRFVDVGDMIYFDEPVVDYNLYSGSFAKKYGEHIQYKEAEKKRLYTAAHQHIAHWNILKTLDDKYDVVIRMRYDMVLGSHKKQLLELCEHSHNTGQAIGVGNTNSTDDADKKIHLKPFTEYRSNGSEFMLDFMTIHKPKNIANVDELHAKKELWPTNTGWWLLLSAPGYGHKNYRCGIQLARKIGHEIKHGR